MSVGVDLNAVKYNGGVVTLAPKVNEKAAHSTTKQVHNFVSSAYGAYRFTQVPGKVGSVAAEVASLAGAGDEVVKPIKDVSKVFNTAANGMIWGYWAWVSFEVVDQVSEVQEKGAGEGRFLELFRLCVDWITAGCHSLTSLLPNFKSIFGSVSTVTDLTNDTIESFQAGEAWSKADNLLSQGASLSAEVQEGLNSEKKLQLIALIKSVTAVVMGIFGLLGLILGVVIIPSIVMATMGLATCALAIIKHFYKENINSQSLSKWEFRAAPIQQGQLQLATV